MPPPTAILSLLARRPKSRQASTASTPSPRPRTRAPPPRHPLSTPAPPRRRPRPPAPDHLTEKELAVFAKLARELRPEELQVQDVSGGCGSMYAIEIASARFRGLSTMQQHRMVNGVLGEEIRGWHGVQLRTRVA
ncbi:MAG: bola [Lasallia pustulata]|uniref:Bola n=1 Tax=Lasallia pustulata TaxID=136370 RepID=A0A5M8PPH6_9LECA|nr:MAG: bola [Lasallia pustulata]